jgi:putative colanic acid biosynthesis acetyltransferase WcaF
VGIRLGFGSGAEAGLRSFSLNNCIKNGARQLDIARNRAARKYSAHQNLCRGLWFFGVWLLRVSPRPFFQWRCFVLRCFGARIGACVRVCPSTRILFPWNLRIGDWSALAEDVRIYNPGLIEIGERVTISHGAHLCSGTHDYSQPDLPLLKPTIKIGDNAWICTEAFIGPGVRVGAGAVVGARAVVSRSVDPWTIVVGNPARCIRPRQLNPKRV